MIKMSELKHYGIQGQKWGIRRWQNADGSFNEEGKKRYGRIGSGVRNANRKRLTKAYNASMRDAEDLRKHGFKEEAKAVQKVADNLKDYLDNYQKSGSVLTPNQKKVFGIGAVVVTAAIAGYGAYKISQLNKGGTLSEIGEQINKQLEKGPEFINKTTGRPATPEQANLAASIIKERTDNVRNYVDDRLDAMGIDESQKGLIYNSLINAGLHDQDGNLPSSWEESRKAINDMLASYNEKITALDAKKVQVENDIVNRHKEAAQVIGKMVSDIQSGKNTGPETEQSRENKRRLDNIARKLNDSIDKAREVGVPESQIIHDLSEANDYFTGGKKND